MCSPQLFRVLPNFHSCFYNSIETRRTFFLNTVTKKKKNNLFTRSSKCKFSSFVPSLRQSPTLLKTLRTCNTSSTTCIFSSPRFNFFVVIGSNYIEYEWICGFFIRLLLGKMFATFLFAIDLPKWLTIVFLAEYLFT